MKDKHLYSGPVKVKCPCKKNVLQGRPLNIYSGGKVVATFGGGVCRRCEGSGYAVPIRRPDDKS